MGDTAPDIQKMREVMGQRKRVTAERGEGEGVIQEDRVYSTGGYSQTEETVSRKKHELRGVKWKQRVKEGPA